MVHGNDDFIDCKSWPFREAYRIIKNITENKCILETGYGPSGLPHIGTFAEVLRTSMIRNALQKISPNLETHIFVVSDDMDGLRKVPDNLPNREMLARYIDYPITSIPDPFEKFASFGEYMNNQLCTFLDSFDFDYTFKSATECYKSGVYNEMLKKILINYDKVMNIILPTLGEERKKTYSPFLPICKRTNKVLQVPMIRRDIENYNITYIDPETAEEVTLSVLDGNCKLQWKPDWGMRWAAFNVNYEMYGKDIQPSADLSTKICKVIGKKTPVLFRYELFLDHEGHKISKSKGNGLSISEWVKYATTESLSLYMFYKPQTAKRLHFDVIPKVMDEYISLVIKYHNNDNVDYDSPVYHVHNGKVPNIVTGGITFSLLLNLVSACNPENIEILLGFIKKYVPDLNIEEGSFIRIISQYAMQYYKDFVHPNKEYKSPSTEEKEHISCLLLKLKNLKDCSDSDTLQSLIFQVGKDAGYTNLREWFMLLYEVLLGQKQGPRMGSFFALYGLKNSIKLIEEKIV